MKLTFVDVLLSLPVDSTLRGFLTDAGLPLPDDFSWDDGIQTSEGLVAAIRGWADLPARDQLLARLMAGVQLVDAGGTQAVFQAAVLDGGALSGLVACQSDLHRSFWLYVQHPELFERACEFDYLERHGSRAHQHELGVRVRPIDNAVALTDLRQAVSAFYKRELQCGDGCVAYLVERSPGVFLLTVHVKDLAMLQLEFEGAHLKRRVGHPNIHMVLEYSVKTGVVRTLARGGAKYHLMLVDAFAEQLLGVKVDARRIRPPTLDLSALKLGFDVPQAMADGFTALQVKSIIVLTEDTGLKLDCTAMASSEQGCVTDLMRKHLPNDNPLDHGWSIKAASINLYYPPELGKTRSKVVTVEVTRRGRLNLNKFDAVLQSQLEGYLVTLGILQPGQTLNAQESQPEADASLQEPVYED